MSSIVRRPFLTAVSNSGSIVSNPGNPGGGASESFSDTACGAKEGEEGREGGREGGREECIRSYKRHTAQYLFSGTLNMKPTPSIHWSLNYMHDLGLT